PGTTWYVSTWVSAALSFSRAFSLSWGILAKASSVGAKTVNGPGPFKVSTSPAACTAVTKVLNDPADLAVSTISAACAMPQASVRVEAIIKRFIADSDMAKSWFSAECGGPGHRWQCRDVRDVNLRPRMLHVHGLFRYNRTLSVH